jgi:hypothetical protein
MTDVSENIGTSSGHLVRIGNPGPMPPPVIPGPAAIIPLAREAVGKKMWPKRTLGVTGSRSAPQAGTSKAAQNLTSGPTVSVPGDDRVTAPDLPHFLKHLPTNPTFPDAHKAYDTMRNWLASRAFKYVELVIVKSSLMYMKPGNKRPSIVSVSLFLRALVYRR